MFFTRVFLLFVLTTPVIFVSAQTPPSPPEPAENTADIRLPNGRSQKQEIIKADHAKNLEDAAELAKLSDELKTDLEKSSAYVFSIADMKKIDEIEKIARRIRSRMKRY